MKDIDRLVAIEDIRSLQARYVRYADLKTWSALADLFMPGAQFIPHGLDGKPQMVMTGRDQIEKRVSASVGAATALHHLFSYEISVDSPTRARGVWAMEDWIDHTSVAPETTGTLPGFRTMHGCGHYHAAYEKVGDDWFIAELKLFRVTLDYTY